MPLVFKELSMTRYDFTTQPNRLDQNTMKWHEAESNPELLEPVSYTHLRAHET